MRQRPWGKQKRWCKCTGIVVPRYGSTECGIFLPLRAGIHNLNSVPEIQNLIYSFVFLMKKDQAVSVVFPKVR